MTDWILKAMRWWIFPVSVVVALFSVWLLIFLDVPLATLLGLAAGAVSLAWLVLLLIVPWNLYFAARGVGQDIVESRERGIQIPAGRDAEVVRIARRMLVTAIGGHLVSAAVIATITFFSGSSVGYYFAGFYLLATAFRPSAAYFRHLRRRVALLAHETRYPRDDVVKLISEVEVLTEEIKRMDRNFRAALSESGRRFIDDLERVQARLRETTGRGEALEHKVDLLTQQFEQTVDRLGDNHEVITGLKAFMRLVRSTE